MPSISHTPYIGTGHSYVRLPKSKLLELQNRPVTLHTIQAFLCQCDIRTYKGDRPTVKYSKRRCRNRWGTAWPTEGRCTVYRWTVLTVLHEVAHLVAPLKKRIGGSNDYHGRHFGEVLEQLIEAYEAWKGGN